MVETQVKQVLSAVQGRQFSDIYFVACGGSCALMQPSEYMVDTKAKRLSAHRYNANEFIWRNLPALGASSVVITCSQEGETPETVAATRFAREKGATTIALAMVDASSIEKEAEYFIKYGHYETSDAIDTSYGVMYLLTAGILDAQEGLSLYAGMEKNLCALTPVIQKAKQQYEAAAMDFATRCKDANVIYSLAAGPDFSQSYVMCNCYLLEMQWMNAIAIHAGEFFHGPFEIIEKHSPVVLLMGLAETRFLEERALKFCKKYTDELFLVDMQEVDFAGVDEGYRGLLSTLVINNICRLYCKTIAQVREHSLDIRRYMHIVEY